MKVFLGSCVLALALAGCLTKGTKKDTAAPPSPECQAAGGAGSDPMKMECEHACGMDFWGCPAGFECNSVFNLCQPPGVEACYVCAIPPE